MTHPLPAGKVPPELLSTLIDQLPTEDAQLLLGPRVGEDAAVIDFAPDAAASGAKSGSDAGPLLVAKSDPITFATDEIGFYAVNVCANDLAVTGATPRFYLPTLLLPAGTTTEKMVAEIFAQIGAACRALGVVVAGGHSEITPSVNQPVVAGTLLGQVERGKLVSTGGCRPGDLLLMAGAAPVEGISIIAREKASELRMLGWSEERLQEAAGYLHEPGISVLRPALLAAQAGLVTAMHDPTEGGVATGLVEMALAANVGIEVDLAAIPIARLGLDLCAAFGLDPLGTIASGALLACAKADCVDELRALWQAAGWSSSVVGRVVDAHKGVRAEREGVVLPFPYFDADEITKIF